jgi:hypothetical protein
MSNQPPTFTDEKVIISANDAIGHLIAAKGNASLAAVYASKERNTPITEAQLISAITEGPPDQTSRNLSSLTAQLRVLLVLNTVEAFRITHTAFVQSLPNLSAKETANTYTRLLQSLTVLATPPPPSTPAPTSLQLSPTDLLKLMPPEVQQAFAALQDPEAPSDGPAYPPVQ